ncbi:MAG: hypothetical protein J3Q66DRAFT_427729 [Benniella sp.]|nr:MAG: hypothetical protein J3Q66DRAFT_427729 [Benniella sp.]
MNQTAQRVQAWSSYEPATDQEVDEGSGSRGHGRVDSTSHSFHIAVQFIVLKTFPVSKTEAMNDAIGSLPQDRTEITGSGMSAPTLHSQPNLVLCLGFPAPVCDFSLQGAATQSNTAVPTQASDGIPLESHPTLPLFNSIPPLHPSLQSISLNLQAPTMEAPESAQRLEMQHIPHQKQHLFQTLQLRLAHRQHQKEQLQLQLEWQDQQIQHLQWQLVQYHHQHHTQHPQQLDTSRASSSFQQQQLLSQLVILMDNGIQPSTQPSLVHYPPAPQTFLPPTINCSVDQTERQDQVQTGSKTEARRTSRRLTHEQSRDIISRLEGEDPESFQTIAKALGCSKSTVWRQRQKYLRQTKPIQKEDSQ